MCLFMFPSIKKNKKKKKKTIRAVHVETFQIICNFVCQDVIDKKNVILATSLFELYTAEFLSSGGSQEDTDSHTVHSLTKKIKDAFPKEISILLFRGRSGNFTYSPSVSEADATTTVSNT